MRDLGGGFLNLQSQTIQFKYLSGSLAVWGCGPAANYHAGRHLVSRSFFLTWAISNMFPDLWGNWSPARSWVWSCPFNRSKPIETLIWFLHSPISWPTSGQRVFFLTASNLAHLVTESETSCHTGWWTINESTDTKAQRLDCNTPWWRRFSSPLFPFKISWKMGILTSQKSAEFMCIFIQQCLEMFIWEISSFEVWVMAGMILQL